jgi:hypothetical protein
MARRFLNGIDLNNKRLVNMADGTSATDAVTLQQLQGQQAGLSWKVPVRVATVANGTLATAYANGSTVDGVVLATNDRILLKDQTAGQENGIYIVQASGAPVRATDADTTAELENATVFVSNGTVNADKAFTQTATVTTVNTTAQVWVQFGAGTSITAGNGLTGTTTFSVLLDTASGMIVSGTGLKIDTAVVVRKFSADCVVTTNPQTFTHNLGSKDVQVTVRRTVDDVLVDADVTATSTTAISVDFGGAPTAAQYRVTVEV